MATQIVYPGAPTPAEQDINLTEIVKVQQELFREVIMSFGQRCRNNMDALVMVACLSAAMVNRVGLPKEQFFKIFDAFYDRAETFFSPTLIHLPPMRP